MEKEKNLLQDFYGKSAFLKVKQALEIGKVQFEFVDINEPKKYVSCFLSAEEFGILMADISDKSMIKALIAEKAKGDKYPKAIWVSPIGGNATGNNGTPISRFFEISPGSSSEVLFTAYAYPAEKNATGAFIAKKGASPLLTLRVPTTFAKLKELAYKWSWLESDYMSKKYTLENMKSEYQHKETEDVRMEPEPEEKQPEKKEEEKPPIPAVEAPSATEKSDKEKKTITATSELVAVSGKDIQICQVKIDGKEYRMLFLMNKIKENLSDFQQQLSKQVAGGNTLQFNANVSFKGSDVYFISF